MVGMQLRAVVLELQLPAQQRTACAAARRGQAMSRARCRGEEAEDGLQRRNLLLQAGLAVAMGIPAAVCKTGAAGAHAWWRTLRVMLTVLQGLRREASATAQPSLAHLQQGAAQTETRAGSAVRAACSTPCCAAVPAAHRQSLSCSAQGRDGKAQQLWPEPIRQAQCASLPCTAMQHKRSLLMGLCYSWQQGH